MFSLGGILFVANGLFRNYIPNEYLLEIYFSMYYCIILAFFTLYLILYKLFDIRKEFPILHRIIQWKVVATFLNMAINQTAFFCWPNYPLKLYEIGNVMLILYPLFLFGICFVMYKRYRSEKALYFLLLFTFTLVFTVFFSLLPFSFVSHNQLMVFRWIIVFEGIAVLLILHRDLYRSKIEAIELQKNLILEEKKSMENYLNGLLDERNRIAEELHDSVSANLSALVLKMKNENLQETNLFYFQELKKIQDDIRSTSHNLHPITLKNNNLTSIINNEIARLENYFDDVNFEFSYGNIEEFDAITQQHKEIIYFTCCELIQNALKHSKANKITIDLKINKEQLSIKVSDNGKGYSLNNSTEGIGLKTIYKRATSVHGNFTIQQNTQGMSHVFTIPFNYNKRK
jgi:signal transduction histidine kinase